MKPFSNIKRHFTPTKILAGVLAGIIAAFIYDYYTEISNKDKIFAEVTVENVHIPSFLNNSVTERIGNKIDLMIIRTTNSSKDDLPINYIEINYISELYGISSDIDKIKYGNNIFDENQIFYDKNKKNLVFKGLKMIPGEKNIGVYVWGDILKMPNIIDIRSISGTIPVTYSNLFGSLSYTRIYLAKHMGFLITFFILFILFLYLQGKTKE